MPDTLRPHQRAIPLAVRVLALEGCVRHALSQEPDLSLGVGVDEAFMRYVRAAMAAMESASS